MIQQQKKVQRRSLSCIYLIFVNQTNLVIDSVIHPLLRQNCQHKVIFCTLNLKFEYLPLHVREVFDYEKTENDLINRAIDQLG